MREGLEGQWEEKDKILADAQRKLSALEAERLEASEKLDVRSKEKDLVYSTLIKF